MPSYRFADIRKSFEDYVEEHKTDGRRVVMDFYRTRIEKEPTPATLYNWYNAIIRDSNGKTKKK